MRVILDLDNPVVWQNEIERQRQIRAMIERRWEKGLKYKKSTPSDIKNIFGFHFV